MDQSLLGKPKAAVKCHQKKWRLSPDEWETLAKLCAILKVSRQISGDWLLFKLMLYDVIQKFRDATLEFLQTKVPTISKVLPLFKMIQQHLEDLLRDPDLIKDKSGQKYCGLKSGIKAGLDKINIHLERLLSETTLSLVLVSDQLFTTSFITDFLC